MQAIDIARRLAALGGVKEAADAYALVLHEGAGPAEELEAAVYILQSGGDYKISYTCFCKLYNQGHFREQILPIMAGAFYEPNVKELRSRYERNCKLLKKYPYLFRKDFPPFEELPILFFPYDDEGYVPFYPDRERFGEYINFKNPVVSRNFFHDLEKPVLADDVYSQYELEYLHDNVRASEDIGRENHLYLHYADWGTFCAYLPCLDFHRLLGDEKIVFLMEEEIRRYPIDFQAEYGVDYSRYPLKPVGIREVNRLIWHAQLSAHNGGDFFNEVFDAHPNLLTLASIMMDVLVRDVGKMEEKMHRAKSLRQAQELFAHWRAPGRVEELYRLKNRTGKDFLVAVYLENPKTSVGMDRASRIVPAVFLQPHFSNIKWDFTVEKGGSRTVIESEDYEEIKRSPLLQNFKYIKTFVPMRRFTTSYAATVRFMEWYMPYQAAADTSGAKYVSSDLICERLTNRSFMVDPEDRLYKDSVLVRFEDAKLNPTATFTALAAFLDIPYAEIMTRCTEGGKDFEVPGRVSGFDTATVYKTYDEFAGDAERCAIEYFLRDAYEYYGYDFQHYDGSPVDEARFREWIQGFDALNRFIRTTWKNAFDATELLVDDRPATPEEAEAAHARMLEEFMQNCDENRLEIMQVLARGLRFINKNGQPLRMLRMLEPDPALLEQPLYH